MLRNLNDLLSALKPASPRASPPEQADALQLATAVLLVEVMRADSKGGDAEKASVLQALRAKFALADDELARLYELAEQRSTDAHDLHSFTSRINAAFDESQKVRILEQLWQVAYADGHLDAHETHLMRRLADLLHVRQSAALGAKLRAVLTVAGLLVLGAGALGPASAVAATAKAGSTYTDCPGCPEMVVVPPGSFSMGFDGGEPERYEGPVRQVRIGYAFAAGKYEVTNAQYRAFVQDTGRVSTKGCYALSDGTYKSQPGKDWEDPGYGRPIRDDEPAACITWTDAKAYVTWLARRTGKPYRLLSEAEWEYAARAGRAGRFTWGDTPQRACAEANVFDRSGARALPGTDIPVAPCDDGFPGLAPVGRLAANGFGLHDMIGNVWEWVEDCYTMPHLAGAPVNGAPQVTNGCDRRGSKGGAWVSSFDRQRPAFRGRDPVDRISQIFGFRVARD